jgi:hypothetical protein
MRRGSTTATMQKVKCKSNSLAVKGSLKAHYSWWRENVTNKYILNIIENGYDLPLLALPVKSYLNNNKSARDAPEFVSAEISKLLLSGVLIASNEPPIVINPLTVAVSAAGKQRLVLDLRTVNPLIHVNKYKFEDISVAALYFRKGCYMVSFDLKSGYHHVDINPVFQQYLGCAWDDKYYMYGSLPFGLSSSGLVFTKVLKELVKRWRALAIPIVLYLDDGIIIADTFEKAKQYGGIVKHDLEQAGFVINEQKSCWDPTQKLNWLGFTLDSKENIFEVPQDKIDRLKCAIFGNLVNRHRCSARLLASTLGKITCLFHALGQVVYLMTKNAQIWIAQNDSWGNKSALPESVLVELRFWHANIDAVQRMPLEKPLSCFTKIIFSDASATGCGAFVKNCGGTSLIHYWTPHEKLQSSTWRELKTVEVYMRAKISELAGLAIKWYTDNQGVPRVIFKGSMVQNLQELALEIFEMCIKNSITLSIDWIPRDENEMADELSKHRDIDDWQVNDNIFNLLNRSHGPFTVDCFASNLTKKVEKFYAKFCCEGVAGVDAFAFNWAHENAWLVPPPRLIPKVISHCKLCTSQGVLIVPKWMSAAFWPFIMSQEGWRQGIRQIYEFKNPEIFFCRGAFTNSVFTEGRFSSNVLVLKLDFQVQKCKIYI